MGHDEALITQKSGKAPSPPKDQPTVYPYLDWSSMQSFYGPGMLPPTFFTPGAAPGHVPPPYMWGPQNLPPAAFGKPYAAIYPHTGGFLHPFMPLMVNPLSAEPAKSVNSKENNLHKKLKENDGTAVSTGSGNSEKTSGDYSLEGSSDGNNQKMSGTPKKRSLDDRTTSGVETCGASAPNDIPGEPGRLATLANVCIPETAIKPCASTGSDFRVSSTPSTEWAAKDDKESKRERRKQSNRESARRSRFRKQAETEELARKVELLRREHIPPRRNYQANRKLPETEVGEFCPDGETEGQRTGRSTRRSVRRPNRRAAGPRREKLSVDDGRRGEKQPARGARRRAQAPPVPGLLSARGSRRCRRELIRARRRSPQPPTHPILAVSNERTHVAW